VVGTVLVGSAVVAGVVGVVRPRGTPDVVGVFDEKSPFPTPVAATTMAVTLKSAMIPAPMRSPLPLRGAADEPPWCTGGRCRAA
jgi:hypothetical protein